MPRYKRSVSFPDEDAINEGLGNLQQRGIHTSQAGLGKLKTVVCKILKGWGNEVLQGCSGHILVDNGEDNN